MQLFFYPPSIYIINLDFKYLIYSKCQHMCLYVFCWYLSSLVFSDLSEFVWLMLCCLENSSHYLLNVFVCPFIISFSWIFLSSWESKHTIVRLLRFILQSMSPLIFVFFIYVTLISLFQFW